MVLGAGIQCLLFPQLLVPVVTPRRARWRMLGHGEPLGKTGQLTADGGDAWCTAASANGAGTGLCQGCGWCGYMKCPGSRGLSHVEGSILSPVLFTPLRNAQGGTKAAQFQVSSVSPSQKSLKSEGLCFHFLRVLELPDPSIQSFNFCNAFNNT